MALIWGGWVESFLKSSVGNSCVFKASFVCFMESLEVTSEDINHLLANLSAYFALKNKGRLVASELFLDAESAECVTLNHYLNTVIRSSIFEKERDRIYRHAHFMNSNGNNFILELLGEK